MKQAGLQRKQVHIYDVANCFRKKPKKQNYPLTEPCQIPQKTWNCNCRKRFGCTSYWLRGAEYKCTAHFSDFYLWYFVKTMNVLSFQYYAPPTSWQRTFRFLVVTWQGVEMGEKGVWMCTALLQWVIKSSCLSAGLANESDVSNMNNEKVSHLPSTPPSPSIRTDDLHLMITTNLPFYTT